MSNQGTILVTGATGNTGSGVAASLLAQGQAVRALVRDEHRAAGLREAGAELVLADLDRPETLPNALFASVTRIYLGTWNGRTALLQSRNFLAALERSRARPHVVRLVGFGTPESRIISELLRCEDELRASGLPVTTLAPTFFMQNVLMAAPTIAEQGAIYWDWADGKVGMIDVRDIVDSAVAVLASGEEQYADERFVLTGPAAIGFADVAQILSRVLGKKISYVPVPHEAALEGMTDMGMPAWIAEGYAELNRGFEDGYADTTTDGVERLTGRPPRSFEQFAVDFSEAFARLPVPR
jgi:uncharacterized protein YbjT (DUF2867 family)